MSPAAADGDDVLAAEGFDDTRPVGGRLVAVTQLAVVAFA
jgi:hypothetical protein